MATPAGWSLVARAGLEQLLRQEVGTPAMQAAGMVAWHMSADSFGQIQAKLQASMGKVPNALDNQTVVRAPRDCLAVI